MNIKDFLNFLSPAIAADEPLVIKSVLKMAKRAGFNPEEIYDLAIKTRPNNLLPAPSKTSIFPL